MLQLGSFVRSFQVINHTGESLKTEYLSGATIYLATKNQEITPELNKKMRQDFPDSSEHCEYIRLDVSDTKTIEDIKELIR